MRWASRPADVAGTDPLAGWRAAEYCVIDVETTGLDPRRDNVISVGSAYIRDGRVVCSDNYYSLIRPDCPVSVSSMRIHGLRPADLVNAPAARDVGREVAGRLAGRVLVAHAAWFDRAFLGRLLRQAGVRLAGPVIDTAALARALGYAHDTAGGSEPSLELLARQLSLPVYAPHHALGDAVTTAAVFLALASQAGQPGGQAGPEPASLRSLLALSARHAN
jgi:DNA polymerase-3 subunit epsilon